MKYNLTWDISYTVLLLLQMFSSNWNKAEIKQKKLNGNIKKI